MTLDSKVITQEDNITLNVTINRIGVSCNDPLPFLQNIRLTPKRH